MGPRGGFVVKDADGKVLGPLVDYYYGEFRFVDDTASLHTARVEGATGAYVYLDISMLWYSSSDCSGAPLLMLNPGFDVLAPEFVFFSDGFPPKSGSKLYSVRGRSTTSVAHSLHDLSDSSACKSIPEGETGIYYEFADAGKVVPPPLPAPLSLGWAQ